MNRNVPAAISTLTVLLDKKSEIRRRGVASPGFDAWRRESLDILAKEFGEGSSYFVEFNNINFQIAPRLKKRAKHIGQRIVHTKGNLTRIAPSLSLVHTESHHFQQAVERAAEVLLAACLKLKNQADLE